MNCPYERLPHRSALAGSQDMEQPSRNIDRRKVYTGVAMICAAVLLMLIGQERTSLVFQVVWIILLGIGLLFYLWGRFFSRGSA